MSDLLIEYKKYKSALRGLCVDRRWNVAMLFIRDYFNLGLDTTNELEGQLKKEYRLGNYGSMASLIDEFVCCTRVNNTEFLCNGDDTSVPFYKAVSKKFACYMKKDPIKNETRRA